jgi:hypothetical protein
MGRDRSRSPTTRHDRSRDARRYGDNYDYKRSRRDASSERYYDRERDRDHDSDRQRRRDRSRDRTPDSGGEHSRRRRSDKERERSRSRSGSRERRDKKYVHFLQPILPLGINLRIDGSVTALQIAKHAKRRRNGFVRRRRHARLPSFPYIPPLTTPSMT